ncbi:MAG: hypothetical protein V1716_04865, partial [Candidatus Uhrbacteria bacterium]
MVLLSRLTPWKLLGNFFLTFLFVGAFFIFSAHAASADTHTWDGGGGDENWSTCANWDTSDTCPVAGDSVIFSGTSTKNSTIDASFGGTIAAFSINAGYSGIITQSRSLVINGAFVQSAGTFSGGSDALDFNSSFTINNAAASFTSTSGTLTIAGSWTHSAGTFAHHNGSVVYDGSGQGTQTFDVNTNEDFYNFTIDCSGSGTECAAVWFVLASGDSLTANHNFYFTDGHVAVSGGGHFHAKGDIFTSDGYSVSNGTSFNLYVDGTSLQTITTSGTGYFYGQNLIINNSAGVNLVGNILMTGSSVQAITLQAGI